MRLVELAHIVVVAACNHALIFAASLRHMELGEITTFATVEEARALCRKGGIDACMVAIDNIAHDASTCVGGVAPGRGCAVPTLMIAGISPPRNCAGTRARRATASSFRRPSRRACFTGASVLPCSASGLRGGRGTGCRPRSWCRPWCWRGPACRAADPALIHLFSPPRH